MLQRLSTWDWFVSAFVIFGVLIGLYYLIDGQYLNGTLVLGGIAIGSLARLTIGIDAITDPDLSAESDGDAANRGGLWRWLRDDGSESIWLRSAVIAGFGATIVMSFVLLIGYLSAGLFADQDGTAVGQWFHGLTNNTLTDDTFDTPLGAYSLNLLAGVVWALIYAAFFERRLSGAGWWRGVKFSVLPWLLSLVAFFPLIGAGFFGASLDAGPLPAIGNLILHVAYGAGAGLDLRAPGGKWRRRAGQFSDAFGLD